MIRVKNMISKIAIYLVLGIFGVLWIMPITVAVKKSFNINGLGNYKYVLNYEKISYYSVILNSFFIAAMTAISVIIITTLAGYAFSKMTFRGSRLIYIMILACLAIPLASVIMPLFFTIKKLGILDTYSGVILPMTAFNAPMMLMITKNYFDTIPNELLESAEIDGCSTFQKYRLIMMPLAVPILANVGVLTFVYTWNDYLTPLLVIRDEGLYTVTLASQYFMETTYQSPENIAQIYAAMLLMTLPSVLVYLLSQRYLQTGITAGSVKG